MSFQSVTLRHSKALGAVFLKEDDLLCIKNLSQVHLDIIMNQMRNLNWNHIDERKYAISFYMALKLSGISRQNINSIMQLTGKFKKIK